MPYIAAATVEGLPSRRSLSPPATEHHVAGSGPGDAFVGYALVDLAAVSYLGLGVQPPASEWGLMVATGQNSILSGHPQESLYAGLCIIATVVASNVLGDRLAGRMSGART